MIDLVVLRPYLIIALIIVSVGGIWNQKRIKNKKLEEELYGELNPIKSSEVTSFDESEIPIQILEMSKNYIQSYKNQYPKESIQQGLIQIGVTDEQAKNLINKYW
ncbi:MAG: hypothetical protein ACMXYB_01885 [Candidatus Woesearchaeota archaeon]